MKKLTSLIVAAAFSLPVIANTVFVPPVPAIAGKAYYLTDFHSGETIASLNPDQRIEPASLTKLMTAYLTFKALKEKRLTLDQTLTVSQQGWKTEGSRMFLDPKVPAKVDDLIKGMIVQSGNDACVTLSEAIAGSEEVFAQLMTAEAKRLGMKDTNFQNSTGLPGDAHYTTAHDLGVLATSIIRDFPQFYQIYSMKSFTYNGITQPNRNLLLYRDPNVDGMKTGFTNSAGYNLIASSHRDGRRVVSVVVGTASPEARAVESSKLLNYGLQFFETPKLYEADKAVSEVSVYKGEDSKLAIGFNHNVYATVAKGQTSKLKADLTTMQPVIAPIKKGQTVGKLVVSLDGKVVHEEPVVALKDVAEGGFFSRLWDSIKLMLGW
ncbi:D-alanyl-D-alanine carboxypeptidase family protein [Craterilacuibacter sinensis]|uniref:serine-type D-Ala-D-Ala carboxypeptidase n=1 Tax=Craterilacuibacter sinensis TaxID=2686017 RepID=A0A845BR76_9NEIS|nr:D-alanyl-D-alanine carboxypeptidase family protein [Craterilacuibacter sinensis]MXR36981.1 D-alanyl-D-alanine carboxypeptidase [Craterilacuibacter sinensis]RQW25449.1 D-alanyl-D-alanine carboxypeptidase [Rhodobacteraceae bacterium CH30]